MTNHFHLLVQTPEPNLSRGMHWLNTAYVIWFNRRHERSGHLYAGRFKSFLIEKESYFTAVLRYVVLNPVRAKMVRRPDDYRWSGYRATAGLESALDWLDTGSTLASLRPTLRLRSEGYISGMIRRCERQFAFDPMLVGHMDSGLVMLRPDSAVLCFDLAKLAAKSLPHLLFRARADLLAEILLKVRLIGAAELRDRDTQYAADEEHGSESPCMTEDRDRERRSGCEESDEHVEKERGGHERRQAQDEAFVERPDAFDAEVGETGNHDRCVRQKDQRPAATQSSRGDQRGTTECAKSGHEGRRTFGSVSD